MSNIVVDLMCHFFPRSRRKSEQQEAAQVNEVLKDVLEKLLIYESDIFQLKPDHHMLYNIYPLAMNLLI